MVSRRIILIRHTQYKATISFTQLVIIDFLCLHSAIGIWSVEGRVSRMRFLLKKVGFTKINIYVETLLRINMNMLTPFSTVDHRYFTSRNLSLWNFNLTRTTKTNWDITMQLLVVKRRNNYHGSINKSSGERLKTIRKMNSLKT